MSASSGGEKKLSSLPMIGLVFVSSKYIWTKQFKGKGISVYLAVL